MPVFRFRSVEDMTPPSEPRPLDPENLRMAIALSRRRLALDPRRPPAGVHKFRSAREASEARLRWERGRDDG
jgi:hypothetical protein